MFPGGMAKPSVLLFGEIERDSTREAHAARRPAKGSLGFRGHRTTNAIGIAAHWRTIPLAWTSTRRYTVSASSFRGLSGPAATATRSGTDPQTGMPASIQAAIVSR